MAHFAEITGSVSSGISGSVCSEIFTGFSINSSDWSNFGTFLSGISSIVNILVFIAISILIANINNKNKAFELKFERQKEIFSRFLDSYEKFLYELYELKIFLAEISVSISEVNEKDIISYYKKIRTLEVLIQSYFSENELDVDFKTFMEKYSILIGSINANKEKGIIDENIKSLILEIEPLVKSFTDRINSYLKIEIY